MTFMIFSIAVSVLVHLGFEELLRSRLPNFNQHVIARCRTRFGSLVLQAVSEQNADIALSAY